MADLGRVAGVTSHPLKDWKKNVLLSEVESFFMLINFKLESDAK